MPIDVLISELLSSLFRRALLLVLILAGLIAVFLTPEPAGSAPAPSIRQSVAVCDPNDPQQCTSPEGKHTYSASDEEYIAYGFPNDIFELKGSDTKTVRLREIEITGHAMSAAQIDLLLVKRSSAASGGGPLSLTGVPHDSNNPAATATPVTFTTTPTQGDLVGPLRTGQLNLSAAAAGGALFPIDWKFGEAQVQGITLNSSSEAVTLTFSPVTSLPAGTTLHINVEWTEE